MTDTPPTSLRERNRTTAREAILDAAERLLGRGDAEFSMRELAAEAGKGFATPFNHFGSKGAIMQALSGRVIDRMETRFRARSPAGDAVERTLSMGDVAVACLLEDPAMFRVVIGSLGAVGSAPSAVRSRSRALWDVALGEFDGIAEGLRRLAELTLADQIAFGFRGCLSFWIAGEIPDQDLAPAVEATAAIAMLGFVTAERRSRVLASVQTASARMQSASFHAPVP